MKIVCGLLIVVVLTSCSGGSTVTAPADRRGDSGASVTTGGTAAETTGTIVEVEGTKTSTSPDRTRRNVTLSAPVEGVPITSNPLTIRGTARTFENSVNYRVRDERGRVLVESFETATGDLGSFNPWEASVFLTSHPGRRVIVEAFEISARDGSEESLVKIESPYEVAPKSYTLFFHDPKRAPKDCSQVFPYVREMPVSKSALRLVVEALLRGPSPSEKSKGASAVFPMGAAVRSVTIRDGAAIVDFNEKLANVGGACRAQAIRASLDQTLTKLPGVNRVIVRANGSEAAALQP